MNIKDDFLNPTELQFLYKESLKSKIDKAGLSGTQKAQLLDFAFDEQTKALDYMNEILMNNPDLKFEYLAERTSQYKQANLIIHWLTTEQLTPELIGQPTKGKQKDKTSYIWQTDPSKELPELYKLMINKYKLIAPETTYEQFEAVFTGQPIDDIEREKIRKTKTFTNVLLTYFISELFQKSNPNDYLSIAESCFDGAKNLSQAQTNYTNNQNHIPKNHIIIINLLIDLKNICSTLH